MVTSSAVRDTSGTVVVYENGEPGCEAESSGATRSSSEPADESRF